MSIFQKHTTILGNEGGFVLIAALMIMVVLVVLGVSATRNTSVEFQIATFDKKEKEMFFDQETCLGTGKMRFLTWYNNAFISADSSTTLATFPPAGGNDLNGNGINDAAEISVAGVLIGSFEVRHISKIAKVDGDNSLSLQANDYPLLSHIDKPVPGSGFSPNEFEIRQYAITCTSFPSTATQRTILQEGVFQVFNNF